MYFCRLSPDEFRHVCEALYQDGWARMRMLATITVQPHVRKRLTPEALQNEKRLKTAPPPREVAALVNVEIDNAA